MNRLAIISPYRNREEGWKNFSHVIPNHMISCHIDYHIYIIEQSSGKLFNRGKLFNVGFLLLPQNDFTHVCFHDIDMLPAETAKYPMIDMPLHVISAVEQKNFCIPYDRHFGGINIFPICDFKKINGFSNEYWGWGAEDDDLRNRCDYFSVKVDRVMENIFFSVPHDEADKSFHTLNREKRDRAKRVPDTYSKDGLNNCSFNIINHIVKNDNIDWFTVNI